MTTAKRPSLAPKVTRGTEENRASALDQGVKITVDGEDFTVRVGDVTPALARELRQNYGGSFNKLQHELSTDPDIDSISTMVWLARRVNGETVDHGEVGVTYSQVFGDDFDIAVAGREEVDDSPEA